MAESDKSDHDQRLKVLLREFFEQFFECFFPEWARRFDFKQLTWLDKEVFLAPPQGERRVLDLVARLGVREGVPAVREGVSDLVALVHVELESRDSAQSLRPRMFEYYVQLRRDTGLPVLPIGLFLRVGMDGIGWDSYEEHFWEHRIVAYEYAYVGLPALDGEAYVGGEHLLGAALSSLMKVPAQRRAELYAEALKRIAVSHENDYRRFLLAECLEAYSSLDEAGKDQVQKLLKTEEYQEGRALMITTYERGRMQGRREALIETLEAKFGPLTAEVKQRVEALLPEPLCEMQRAALNAESLKELHLED